MNGRYKLVGHEPVEVEDLIEWAQWLETADRCVRLTRVGPYTVSTVFMGLDMGFHCINGAAGPPILFETAAWIDREHDVKLPAIPEYNIEARTLHFDRDFHDDLKERCSTWDEAIAQHEAAIAELKHDGDEVEELVPFTRQVNAALEAIEACFRNAIKDEKRAED